MNKKTHKKCIKCRQVKPKEDILGDSGEVVEKHGFGKHNSSDGFQSICFECKNAMNKGAREKNVSQRVRHHTATRCLTQLGSLAPPGLVRDLEEYLGYTIASLVRHLRKDLKEREGPKRKLRDALNEGYHIDHVRPLSSFNVICPETVTGEYGLNKVEDAVDWGEFRRCWAIQNLVAIPAAENLAKGAKYEEVSAR
jgi:hypothetical protein